VRHDKCRTRIVSTSRRSQGGATQVRPAQRRHAHLGGFSLAPPAPEQPVQRVLLFLQLRRPGRSLQPLQLHMPKSFLVRPALWL